MGCGPSRPIPPAPMLSRQLVKGWARGKFNDYLQQQHQRGLLIRTWVLREMPKRDYERRVVHVRPPGFHLSFHTGSPKESQLNCHGNLNSTEPIKARTQSNPNHEALYQMQCIAALPIPTKLTCICHISLKPSSLRKIDHMTFSTDLDIVHDAMNMVEIFMAIQ